MKTKIEILSEHLNEKVHPDGITLSTQTGHILEAMEEYLQQGIAHLISSKQDVIKSVCEICGERCTRNKTKLCYECWLKEYM